MSRTGWRERRRHQGPRLRRVVGRGSAVIGVTVAVVALVVAAGSGRPNLAVVAGGAPLVVRLDQRPGAGSLSSGCDPGGVSIRYETIFTPAGYGVAAVTIANLGAQACAHKTILVTLTGAGGAVLGEGSATVPPHEADLRIPLTGAPPAEATTGTAVTIA